MKGMTLSTQPTDQSQESSAVEDAIEDFVQEVTAIWIKRGLKVDIELFSFEVTDLVETHHVENRRQADNDGNG